MCFEFWGSGGGSCLIFIKGMDEQDGSELGEEDLIILRSWSSRVNSQFVPSSLGAGCKRPRRQAQKKPRKSARNKEVSKELRVRKKEYDSARRALNSRPRETQNEELAAVRELCKRNPIIPCHSCQGMMKIFTRRIFYKGSSREYLAYRCSKKQCQTFCAPRSLYHLLILSDRCDTKFNPMLVSYQLQAALRDEGLLSEIPQTDADSQGLELRQRIAGLLKKAVASYEAQANRESRSEPDAGGLTSNISSPAGSVVSRNHDVPSSSKESSLPPLDTIISPSVAVPLKRFSTSSSDSGEASSVFHFNDVEKTETLFGIDTSETTNEKRTPGLEDVKVGIPLISATARDSNTDEVELSDADEKSMDTMPTLLPNKKQDSETSVLPATYKTRTEAGIFRLPVPGQVKKPNSFPVVPRAMDLKVSRWSPNFKCSLSRTLHSISKGWKVTVTRNAKSMSHTLICSKDAPMKPLDLPVYANIGDSSPSEKELKGSEPDIDLSLFSEYFYTRPKQFHGCPLGCSADSGCRYSIANWKPSGA